MRAALAGLEDFVIHDDRGRRLEACQSPVWDTALAVVALADAGVDPDDPALAAAALAGSRRGDHGHPGDWAVRRPRLAPGGWAFEFANDNYPDIDDTAEVVLALRRTRPTATGAGPAARWRRRLRPGRGLDHRDAVPRRRLGRLRRRQRQPAGRRPALLRLRRGHRPAVRRRHRPRHRDAGRRAGRAAGRAAARASTGCPAEQEPDGSWFGRWGVNYVYGTGAAVPALVAAGVPPDDARIRRAVAWLEDHQNPDGGWGEDLRSYVDAGLARPGRLDGLADGLGAAGPPGGRARRTAPPSGGAWPGWSTPSGPTAPGTSPGSPAPASRGISTSTTTCTAWSFRSWPSGRYVRGPGPGGTEP